MACPLPSNDEQRVAALLAHHILDTAAEAEYDDLVQLTAQVCETPIALITLVDRDRQWFKARVGLDAAETPRQHSFCAHAICEPDQDVFVVSDAAADLRFAGNPLVTGDPGIRFYAGTPLVTRDGWALGTLCVIDRKPRELTAAQIQTLRILRRHVVNALEVRRLVAEQKAIIAELNATRTRLEDTQQAALQEARTKGRFLATMSHEIRTPLNGVIGMTTLLRTTALSAEQQEYAETIRTSGEVLLTLINDILDFSKIEAGKIEIDEQPFGLAAFINRACDLFTPQIRGKKLRLLRRIDPAVPSGVIGDSTRMGQILVNLLSNAVKFTEAGEIVLSVSAKPLPGERLELHFQVSDTGIGIPADRLDRLFQLFSQAEKSTSRRFGGTGLGLAISRQLAELMGGRMWVESREGRGSTFHFTLIVTPDSTPAAPPATASLDPGLAGRIPARILVVDDNPINLKVASRLLQHCGYQPATATNGRLAVESLQESAYDLVLMDVEMPVLDGPAATEEVRRLLPPERQPVVAALTAHAMPGDRERFLAAGMDDHLTKPLRIGELTALIQRLPDLLAARRQTAAGG